MNVGQLKKLLNDLDDIIIFDEYEQDIFDIIKFDDCLNGRINLHINKNKPL